MKHKNYSSPQLSIYEDKKGMREWKVAEPRTLVLKCWQREILAPAKPAKLRTGDVRQYRVKQTPGKRRFQLWRPNQRDLHSEAPGKMTARVKPYREGFSQSLQSAQRPAAPTLRWVLRQTNLDLCGQKIRGFIFG